MTWLSSDIVVSEGASKGTMLWQDLQTGQRRSLFVTHGSLWTTEASSAAIIEADPAGAHFAVLAAGPSSTHSPSSLLVYDALTGRCLQSIALAGTPPDEDPSESSSHEEPTYCEESSSSSVVFFWLRSSVPWLPANAKALAMLTSASINIWLWSPDGQDYRPWCQTPIAANASLRAALCKTVGDRTLLYTLADSHDGRASLRGYQLSLVDSPGRSISLQCKSIDAGVAVDASCLLVAWDRLNNHVLAISRRAVVAIEPSTALKVARQWPLPENCEIASFHPFGGLILESNGTYWHVDYTNCKAHPLELPRWLPYDVVDVAFSSHGNAVAVVRSDGGPTDLVLLSTLPPIKPIVDPNILCRSLVVKSTMAGHLGLEVLLPVQRYLRSSPGSGSTPLPTFIRTLMQMATQERMALSTLARLLAQVSRTDRCQHISGEGNDEEDVGDAFVGAAPFFELLAAMDFGVQRLAGFANQSGSLLAGLDKIVAGELDVRSCSIADLRKHLSATSLLPLGGANVDTGTVDAWAMLVAGALTNVDHPRLQALLTLASFRKRLGNLLLLVAGVKAHHSLVVGGLDIPAIILALQRIGRDLQGGLYAELTQEGVSLLAVESVFCGRLAEPLSAFMQERRDIVDALRVEPTAEWFVAYQQAHHGSHLSYVQCRWCHSLHAASVPNGQNSVLMECFCGGDVIS